MYSQPQADALSYINATTGDAATVFGPALLGLVRSDARAARRSVSVLFAAVRGWAASVPEVPPHHLPTQLATRLAAAKASAAAAAAADPAAEAVSWLVPLRPVAYAAALLGLCLIVCARRLAAARRGLARASRPEELLQAREAERRRDEPRRAETAGLRLPVSFPRQAIRAELFLSGKEGAAAGGRNGAEGNKKRNGSATPGDQGAKLEYAGGVGSMR